MRQPGSAKPGTARGGGARCSAQDAILQLQRCNQTVSPHGVVPGGYQALHGRECVGAAGLRCRTGIAVSLGIVVMGGKGRGRGGRTDLPLSARTGVCAARQAGRRRTCHGGGGHPWARRGPAAPGARRAEAGAGRCRRRRGVCARAAGQGGSAEGTCVGGGCGCAGGGRHAGGLLLCGPGLHVSILTTHRA